MLHLKHIVYFISALVLFSLFPGCAEDDLPPGNNDFCRPVTADPGIIVQELDLGNCFFVKKNDNYLVEDSATYDSLRNVFGRGITCDAVDFPGIDFSKHAFLGLWADGGGCSIDFYRTAGDDRGNNKYIYTVTVHECGFCEMYGSSYNWVLVPKLPAGYKVEFQVKYIRD